MPALPGGLSSYTNSSLQSALLVNPETLACIARHEAENHPEDLNKLEAPDLPR